MTRISVQTEVFCTEKDGKKTPPNGPILTIRNHSIRANEVVLSVDGVNVTVPAEHLIRAINNATNQPGRPG